jgi:hypothetical protein
VRRTEGRATAGRGRGAWRLGRRGGCRSCSRSCRSLLVCTASRRGGGGGGGRRRRVVQRREACLWWAIRFARGFVDDHFIRHRCVFPRGCLPGGARDYVGAGVARRRVGTAQASGGHTFPREINNPLHQYRCLYPLFVEKDPLAAEVGEECRAMAASRNSTDHRR